MGPHISKMNDLDNKMQVDEESEKDSLKLKTSYSGLIQGSSLETQPLVSKAKSEGVTKKIDKEHVTIERIFRISLEESEKFLYLELYHAQILSQDKEIAFRINDLDDIVINIINHPERKPNIFPYMLETYHRAVEMIEKRFKNEYDSSYKQIRKVIANYLTLIMYSPENFDLDLSKEEITNHLTKYLSETDEEELAFLLNDVYMATCNDMSFLAYIFSFLFQIIHKDNSQSKGQFFNLNTLKKNMALLTALFEQCPMAAQAFVQESQFNPIMANNFAMNGKFFQINSYLSLYLNVAVFEADIQTLKNSFPVNKSQHELDIVTKSLTSRLMDYLKDVRLFIYAIFKANKVSRDAIMQWAYSLLKFNLDKTKMFQVQMNTSTVGFLLNTLIVAMDIFFDLQAYMKLKYEDFVFKMVSQIDPLFTLSNNRIDFTKFDRVNPDLVKEIIENESEDENNKEHNLFTEIFFIIHTLINFSVKNFDEEVRNIDRKIDEMISENKTGDTVYRDYLSILKAANCYIKNQKFINKMIKFSEISSVFLFTLNNTKYPQFKLQQAQFNYYEFLGDFYTHIDTTDNFALSMLPVFVPKNIYQNCLFIRKYCPDCLISDLSSTRLFVYFSIIYSSQVDLIRNPHLRSEIFDILIYLFVLHGPERNARISNISKLLNDDYVKNNLIFSVMRVFIDAERLGTSNQFYDKFSIRHKILYLIDNVMQINKSLYTEKIKEFANESKDESTRMINLMMNDITFLNDEVIERLMEIKKYQDLRDDVERYNALDEETKKLEDDKFKDNEKRVKTELQLFNSSMEFLVMISRICQDNFMNYKLGERLANLLNYSLDIFTSSRGLKLKVKNMNEYSFNPKFVLSSLVSIYACFINYKDFMEYIVMDERSFRIENFEKVKEIKGRGKIQINYEDYEAFLKMVEKLKVIEQEIKSKQVSYEDAPEEFFDPITTLLMDNPVLLPSSNVVVDRNTIETHLLSDPTDPFNRSKLTKDMLVYCKDLQQRIEEYKKSKETTK